MRHISSLCVNRTPSGPSICAIRMLSQSNGVRFTHKLVICPLYTHPIFSLIFALFSIFFSPKSKENHIFWRQCRFLSLSISFSRKAAAELAKKGKAAGNFGILDRMASDSGFDSVLGFDSVSSSGSEPTVDYETDVELLKRAWRQEKAAPEILQYEVALINRVREQIKLMEDTVEEFTESGIDPLTVSLYQMDLDRNVFLLRSYLRIRLQKIEKYTFHILASDELTSRLSAQEKIFAKKCCVDLETHFENSVLSRLPTAYQSVFTQTRIDTEMDMVPKPELDTFVVCKTKYYLGHIQLEDNEDEQNGSASQRPLEEPFEMEPNVLYFVRYKAVKKFVEEGKIDLF